MLGATRQKPPRETVFPARTSASLQACSPRTCSPGQRARGVSLASIQLALQGGGTRLSGFWPLRMPPLGGCPEFEVPGAAGVGGSLMPQGHEACWASTPRSSITMPPASPADGCGRRQMGCRGSRGCLGFPQLLQHVDPDSCLLQGRGLPGRGTHSEQPKAYPEPRKQKRDQKCGWKDVSDGAKPARGQEDLVLRCAVSGSLFNSLSRRLTALTHT